MHALNDGNGGQMVDPRIELTMALASEEKELGMTHTNLIHHRDPRILCLLVKLEHGRGNVARSYDMFLVSNCGFYDSCVKGIWDQTDDKLVLGHRGVKSVDVGNIKGDCLCELHVL